MGVNDVFLCKVPHFLCNHLPVHASTVTWAKMQRGGITKKKLSP